MKNILITGANGLLGRSVSSVLSEQGLLVHGLTHQSEKSPIAGVKLSKLDLASNWSFEELPAQCDAIIHLAQSASFRDFPTGAMDVFKVNIESTARLLEYANSAGVKKFIYASSGGVYGNGSRAFNENAPIVPVGKLGHYLGSKACGEILAQSYAAIFQVTVLRPFFIYGPNQNRSMLIPRLFDSIARGDPISLQGDCGIRINPIHVCDAAKAVAAALAHENSATFNIAGPNVLSLRNICDTMGRYLGVEPAYKKHRGEPNDLIADISAMKKKLTIPKISLEESLTDIAPSSFR